MKRREFIGLIGSAAAALPFWGACAQGNAVPSIGLLDPGIPELFAAFVEGMRELGYVEGQNISYVRFSAKGRPDKVPQLASEIIVRNPDIIVTAGPLPVRGSSFAVAQGTKSGGTPSPGASKFSPGHQMQSSASLLLRRRYTRFAKSI